MLFLEPPSQSLACSFAPESPRKSLEARGARRAVDASGAHASGASGSAVSKANNEQLRLAFDVVASCGCSGVFLQMGAVLGEGRL